MQEALKKNKEKIEELLNEIGCSPDITAISESKIKTTTIDNMSLAQYSFLHKDSNTNADGVKFCFIS